MKGKYVVLKRTAEDRRQWQRLTRAGSHYCFSADYLKKSWPTLTTAALQDVIISDAIMRGPHLTEGPLKTLLSAVYCNSCSSQCCNTFTCCLGVVCEGCVVSDVLAGCVMRRWIKLVVVKPRDWTPVWHPVNLHAMFSRFQPASQLMASSTIQRSILVWLVRVMSMKSEDTEAVDG